MRVSRKSGQLHLSMPIALAAALALLFALVGTVIALQGLRISSEGRAQEAGRGLTQGARRPQGPRQASPGFDAQARVAEQQRTGLLSSLELNVKELRKEATDLIRTKEARLREAAMAAAENKARAALYEELKKQAASTPSGFAGGAGSAGGGMMMGAPMMGPGDMGGFAPPPPPSGDMGMPPPPPPPTTTTTFQQPLTTTTFGTVAPMGTMEQQGTMMQGTPMQPPFPGPMQGVPYGEPGMITGGDMGQQGQFGSPMGGEGQFNMTREQYEAQRYQEWQQRDQEMQRMAKEQGWDDLQNVHMTARQREMMGMRNAYNDFRADFVEESEEEVALEDEEGLITDSIGCLEAFTEEFVDGGNRNAAVAWVREEAGVCDGFFETFDLPGRAGMIGDVALWALTLGLMQRETSEQGVEAANGKLSELGLGNYVRISEYGLLTSGDLYALLQEEAPREEDEEITISGRAVEAPDGSLFLFNAPIEEGGQSVLLGGNISAVPTQVDVDVRGTYDPETQTFVVYDVRVLSEERVEEEHREEEFRGPPVGASPQGKGLAYVGRLLGDLVGGVIGIISELSGVPGNEDVVAQAQEVLPMLNAILGDVTDLIGSETADDPATLARIVADIKEAASGLPAEFLHGAPGPGPGPRGPGGPMGEGPMWMGAVAGATIAEIVADEMIPEILAAAEEADIPFLADVEEYYESEIAGYYDESDLESCKDLSEKSEEEEAEECGEKLDGFFRAADGMKAIFDENMGNTEPTPALMEFGNRVENEIVRQYEERFQNIGEELFGSPPM